MSLRTHIRNRWRVTRKWLIFRLINVWPPYLGSGIRVTRLDLAGGIVETELRSRWWNRNYVGTAYGGSLYSMCDPFFMLILLEHLGDRFIIWDKSASIRFRTPGRGTVRARFEISLDEIESIRDTAMREDKAEPLFRTLVIDEEGRTVAEVEKLVHVKRDRKKKRTTQV